VTTNNFEASSLNSSIIQDVPDPSIVSVNLIMDWDLNEIKSFKINN